MTLQNRVSAMAPWLLLLFVFVAGALPPLHEMDLAQHLATGEWIVGHRAWPFTEPFGWTRAGQPFFAYSWLPEVLYFLLLKTFGPVALHLLTGAIVALAFAAATWAARQFGWRRSTCLAFGALHVALLWGVANTLRPQQLLFIALPLAWGLAARIRATGLTPARAASLLAVGAFAANSHIFFPLTLAPFVYSMLLGGDVKRLGLAGGALVAGWLVNPYVLSLPALFALNFGHNILLERPPAIAEFVPGFEYARHRPGVIAAVLALLMAPWVVMTASTSRERWTPALYWSAGLLLFAYAGRLVLAWWTFAFPLVGLALQRIGEHTPHRVQEGRRAGLFVGATALMLIAAAPNVSTYFWSFEGDVSHRMLPRAGEDATLWLPSWLLCNTRTGAAGRIYAEFNYGSELNWRLPGYSLSIDGRTIFPDSDAIEFSYQPHGRRRTHANTWANADLVLVNHSFWLAPIVSQQPDWILLAQTRTSSRYGVAGLWARRAWWQRWGNPTQLPVTDLRIADPRATCSATGKFPA